MKMIQTDLKKVARADKAAFFPRFFKTGKGEYGEGDVFLGVTVPESRKVAQKHAQVELTQLIPLLESRIHEERLVAVFILVGKYQKSKTEKQKKEIVDFYLKHKRGVNNWDIVDSSAYQILGNDLLDKKRDILYTLARSTHLWDKRIAIVSTYAFIRKHQYTDTFEITKILLNDSHDLLHKACGWMLREIGKRDEKELEKFLKKYHAKMPRTMLRYAIERFPEKRRKTYLKKKNTRDR